jgi:hypothetical protein
MGHLSIPARACPEGKVSFKGPYMKPEKKMLEKLVFKKKIDIQWSPLK